MVDVALDTTQSIKELYTELAGDRRLSAEDMQRLNAKILEADGAEAISKADMATYIDLTRVFNKVGSYASILFDDHAKSAFETLPGFMQAKAKDAEVNHPRLREWIFTYGAYPFIGLAAVTFAALFLVGFRPIPHDRSFGPPAEGMLPPAFVPYGSGRTPDHT